MVQYSRDIRRMLLHVIHPQLRCHVTRVVFAWPNSAPPVLARLGIAVAISMPVFRKIRRGGFVARVNRCSVACSSSPSVVPVA